MGLAWLIPDVGADSEAARGIAWVLFMVRTFSFHAGVGGLAGLALAVLLRLWKPALAAAPLLAGLLLPAAWDCRPRDPEPLGPGAIRVMSCNLLVGSQSPAAVLADIRAHDPDIILFQEYSGPGHAVLEPALREAYAHIIVADREHPFGQAIYSKLAPVGRVEVFSGGTDRLYPDAAGNDAPTDPQLRMTVLVAGREVVVHNIHTASPSTADAVARQYAYAGRLADAVRADPRPVIMGGDFNATPGSRTMRGLFDTGLRSTHGLAGHGRGSTWPAKTVLARLPGVRIDHILIGGGMRCDRSAVLPANGSDHRPIIASVGF